MKRSISTLFLLTQFAPPLGCGGETQRRLPGPPTDAGPDESVCGAARGGCDEGSSTGSVTRVGSEDNSDHISHVSSEVDAGDAPSSERDSGSNSVSFGNTSEWGSCSPSLDVSLSPHIPTVVLVTWNDVQSWEEAQFEYWSEDEELARFPVTPGSSETAIPVLGLRPDTAYQYRVTAKRAGEMCSSAPSEIRTGSAPPQLPRPTVTVSQADQTSPGYLLTTSTSMESDASGYVAVYDHEGVPVWWYRTSIPGLMSRAHFSWDGQHVLARDTNPLARESGRVVRIPMDGSGEELIEIDRGHHDFTPVPDGILFLVGGGEDECGSIQHWSDKGELTEVYPLREAFGETFRPGVIDPCHCNSIDYNRDDDSISVSCLNQNAYVKISSSGELIWVLGGNEQQSHFDGDINWHRQHGHHMLSPSRLLFFNNMGGGDAVGTEALAVELELDLEARSARRVWQYAGGPASAILGDVQYLVNGNVLVTYSSSGELHEVNSAGQLVQRWVFSEQIGYSHHQEWLGSIAE